MAKRVEFTKDYNHTFRPSPRAISSDKQFRKGTVELVPDDVANAAVKGGYAREVAEPKASKDAGGKSQ